MKRLKLLPSILMLIMCVGVLVIGVYSVSPITGTIAGTINITAAPGVKIAVYEGKSTATADLLDSAFGTGEINLNAGGAILDTTTAATPDQVIAQYYTVMLSTNEDTKYVVDTETIQVVDGFEVTSGERVSGAAIITKLHKPTANTVDSNGRVCFTKDKPYTIQISIKCGKLSKEAINVNYNLEVAIFESSAYTGEAGVNGVDYLYFGEYPQAEANVTGLNLTASGTFKAYKESATISSDIEDERPVYTSGTNRYVLYNSKYYLIAPLKWRILSRAEDGTAKIMCDKAIEQVELQKFHYFDDMSYGEYAIINGVNTTIFANNYENSILRKFMNDIFYYGAFNLSEQTLIKTTTVDNSEATTNYPDGNPSASSTPTYDKIFALSYAEATNTDYGFENTEAASDTRTVGASAYAIATGVTISGGFSFWWLRSPDFAFFHYTSASEYNGRLASRLVDDTCGCVPALCLGL